MLISGARFRSRRDSANRNEGIAFTVSGSRLHILRCLRLLEIHTHRPADLWIPLSAVELIPVLERHPRVRRVFVSPAAADRRDVVSGSIPIYGRFRAVVHLECDEFAVDARGTGEKLKR